MFGCCRVSHTGAQAAAQSAWAGLAAGFLHTLCGPDHLAVSPAVPAVHQLDLCILSLFAVQTLYDSLDILHVCTAADHIVALCWQQ